jgi:lantibiotic leader peptide-processing serine protease
VRSRTFLVAAALTASALTATLPTTAGATPAGDAAGDRPVAESRYLVLARDPDQRASARRAVIDAGGRVVRENPAIGALVARSDRSAFAARVGASTAVAGVSRDRVVGVAPGPVRSRWSEVEKQAVRRAPSAGVPHTPSAAPARRAPGAPTPEPLAGRQWNMQQVGATATGSYARERGRRGVLVGILDTGVDGRHPDIAPNFDSGRSRNFTTDMPEIDGPCEYTGCVDPADVDDNEHGTHVASIIGSPLNGLGLAGVAPNVTLVNIRAGQDAGLFFLASTLDALTYAGDAGIDVVNMSFYTDPWLFNCVDNPADSPTERLEQRTIVRATQLAVDYARARGVTLVAALGNENVDLSRPTVDLSSPNFPAGKARRRVVDNSCLSMPTEARGVVGVSSTGPSLRLAAYSNHGVEQTDVAAPGGSVGDAIDGRPRAESAVLAAYPEKLALATRAVTEHCGTPLISQVVMHRSGDVCAYYQYLQGTSMAAPHAAGVAALAVSRFGRPDGRGGLTLDPATTERWLYRTATVVPCPTVSAAPGPPG